MRTISKDKYSLELTNTLREFLKSKYNANTDIGSHTEMDAIKAGVGSPDYLDWSNLDEAHFVNDIHDLWNGKAEIEPEEERNYYKMVGVQSDIGGNLYLGIRNNELFFTPKMIFAYKFTKNDLHNVLIKAKICSTSVVKVD